MLKFTNSTKIIFYEGFNDSRINYVNYILFMENWFKKSI